MCKVTHTKLQFLTFYHEAKNHSRGKENVLKCINVYIFWCYFVFACFLRNICFRGGGITPPGGMKLRTPWGGGNFCVHPICIYILMLFLPMLFIRKICSKGGGLRTPGGEITHPPGGGKFCVNLFIILRKSIYNVIYIPHVILNIIIYILCKKLNKDIFSKFLSTLI